MFIFGSMTDNRNPELTDNFLDEFVFFLEGGLLCDSEFDDLALPASKAEFDQRMAALPNIANPLRRRCEAAYLEASFYNPGRSFPDADLNLEPAVRSQFAPSPIEAPSIEAMSQFFDLADGTPHARFALPSSIPGWAFNISVDGAFISRSFAALSRQTRLGSVSLSGIHAVDPRTVIGLGFKVGAAETTFNTPASTISTTEVGIDLGVGRLMLQNLHGALYFGYDYGMHKGTIAGVTSNYVSHNLKFGGNLEGDFALNAFTITPAASVLLQFRQIPAFTTGALVAVPASQIIEIDARTGVTILRDFRVGDGEVLLSPFIGGNAVIEATTTTPVLVGPVIPVDALRAEVVAGIKVAWGTGAHATLKADLSHGAHTTVFGASGSMTVPIH